MTARRSVRVLLAAGLATALGACGGNGVTDTCPAGTTGSPPNCLPTPPPCTQTSVYQDAGGIPASTLLFDDFSVPDTGRLDLTLDWTIASSPVGLYLVPANTCTLEEFNARQCSFVVRAEPGRPKPIKTSAPNLAAGNYRWLIANFADEQESVSLQIVLSKGTGCAAHAGAGPAASSAGPAGPSLDRSERR